MREMEYVSAYTDSYFISTMMLYRDSVSLSSGGDSELV